MTRRKVQEHRKPTLGLHILAIAFLIQTVYNPPIWVTVLLFFIPISWIVSSIYQWSNYDYVDADAFEELDEVRKEISKLKNRVDKFDKPF